MAENLPKWGDKNSVAEFIQDSVTGVMERKKGVGGALLVFDGGLATKITVSGSITYIGEAAAGTAQATAAWRAQKIDETTGTVITWADGNTNFDNVATDLTALTYS